jgi:ATPase subunit of ABC transporter with duplicated ATPase domains
VNHVKALAGFPGPVLAVSHGRWFIEWFQAQICELPDGKRIHHVDAPESWLDGSLRARPASYPSLAPRRLRIPRTTV